MGWLIASASKAMHDLAELHNRILSLEVDSSNCEALAALASGWADTQWWPSARGRTNGMRGSGNVDQEALLPYGRSLVTSDMALLAWQATLAALFV